MLKTTRGQRGDTIIEVIIAVTVFSLIVVSSLSIMNQGTAASQRALEITQVRQEVDGQAEALRFLHDSYVQAYFSGNATYTGPAGEYRKVIDKVALTASRSATEFGSVNCGTPPAGSFVINPRTSVLVNNSSIFAYPTTYAQLVYSGSNLTVSRGIWIEGVRSNQVGNTSYIDFHIRGCWDAPGLSTPLNIGTIVRLYEPRG